MLLLAPIVRGGLARRTLHLRSLHAKSSRVPLLLTPKELKGIDPKVGALAAALGASSPASSLTLARSLADNRRPRRIMAHAHL